MNGLSTLNRFLGRRKDASRSTSNLSQSTTHLDTSSQYNKIVPITMKDAPFEQTFRVTVMLPKNQLYVERIGAKTKLVKLLDDICESKDLHRHKYEFRHPGDNSVVFDNEQTIGEVGLNELRLVLKTESRFNENFNRFHPNDMLRYKNTVSDSVSSSEISRESKLILRKSSPYSSSNSLNSLDSGGMGATTKVQPPVAPVRKKRAAPRPPSQNSIPEQETVSTNITVFKEPLAILPRKNFHVSSPSLFNNGYQHDHHRSNLSINNNENADNNNNKIQQQQREQQQQQEKRQQQKQSDLNMNRINATAYNANNRPTSMYILSDNNVQSGAATIDKRIAHHNSAMYLNRSRTSSESSEVKDFMGAKMSHVKKRKAPQVPPTISPRPKPVPSPRTVQEEKSQEMDHLMPTLKRSPRELTPESNYSIDSFESNSSAGRRSVDSVENDKDNKANVSKVMLNVVKEADSQEETNNGPVSIQIVVEKEHERSKSNSPTKVTITRDDPITVIPEMSDSDEDESGVNVYNLKSARACVTPEIPVKVDKGGNETVVEAIVHKEDAKLEVVETVKQETVECKVVEEKLLGKSADQCRKSPEAEISRKSPDQSEIKQKVIEKKPESPKPEIQEKMSRKSPDIPEKPRKSPEKLMAAPEQKPQEITVKAGETPGKSKENPPESQDDRPQSPLWTYTLPAPPTFADNSQTMTDHTTIGTKYYNDFISTVDNDTVISDNTTIISDVDIKPVIRERNVMVSQTILFEKPMDVESNKSTDGTDVITSDIEDGYQGDKVKGQDTPIINGNDAQEISQNKVVQETREEIVQEIRGMKMTQEIHEVQTIQKIQIHQESHQKSQEIQENQPKKSEDPVKMEEELIVSDLVKTIKENFRLEVKNGFEQEAQVGYDSANEKSLLESDVKRNSFEKQQNFENLRRSNEIRKKSDVAMEASSRNSITTISYNPKMIVRSDSFHSVGQHVGKNGPGTMRSTSFVSLINAQKAENRLSLSNGNINLNKKLSSSELSISDSPSLQSLEVLKSILNTPKKKEEIKEIKEEIPVPVPAKIEEKEQKWKYQGPPKINLTTWSERPKIEVSIKSDQDYKFGGSATLPRGFKNQTIQIRSVDQVDCVPAKTLEDQENRLPKVLGVEYKKNVSPVHLREDGVSRTIINIKPRPMSMDAAKLWSQPVSFNRLSTNHSKFVPVVHGFSKLNEINENSVGQEEKSEPTKIEHRVPPAVPSKPNYLRSSSAGDVQKKFRFTTYENRNDPEPQLQNQDLPFSQNSLKRTGLKEKILSSDKETESIFGRVIETKPQKMKISTQQSAPAPPTPPKALAKTTPVVRGVVKKQMSAPEVDPRSQLLDSIKNFNKNSLRKK